MNGSRRSPTKSHPLLMGVLRRVARAIDTPEAHTVLNCVDLSAVLLRKQEDSTPLTARAWFERNCLNLLSHYEGDVPGVDKLLNTDTRWIESERMCFRANRRLFPYCRSGLSHPDRDAAIARHLDGVRKIIESWVGRPAFTFEGSFTTGSTASDRGERNTVAHKLQAIPSTTSDVQHTGYNGFICTLWHQNMVLRTANGPDIVRGEEYFTVPKRYNVLRSAGLQPTLNVYLQRGRGLELKRRLSQGALQDQVRCGLPCYTHGWRIESAADIHRLVAEWASRDRRFATIDLTSASDCLSVSLVEALWPREWFDTLDKLRTKLIFKSPANPTGWYKLEKFSSMGNGFTFEVETITFAAVACYVVRQNGLPGVLGHDVFVFGDDIIVPDRLSRDVIAFLRFLGFETNSSKTFTGGHPFRESCGADFFRGQNVRGVYPEKEPETVQELFSLANQIYALKKRGSALGLDFTRAWLFVLNHIPKMWRLHGPPRLGDSVIHDDCLESWTTRERDGILELKCLENRVLNPIPWHCFDMPTRLACAVLKIGNSQRGVIPRKPDLLAEYGWVSVS